MPHEENMHRRRLLLPALLLALLLALLPTLAGAVDFDDGGTHIVDDNTYAFETFNVVNDTLVILEPGAEAATTAFATFVSISGGGSIHMEGGTLGGSARWQLLGSGEFLLNSGVILTGNEGLFIGEASFRALGGSFQRTSINATGSAIFEIAEDVTITDSDRPNLVLTDVAQTSVRVGQWGIVSADAQADATLLWNADADTMGIFSGVTATIDGGIIDVIDGFGEFEIQGGQIGLLNPSFGSLTNLVGGEIAEIDAGPDSLIRVEGSDFNYANGAIADLSGTLTGVLLDGSAISAPFTRHESATLQIVPEPGASGALLAAGASLALLSRRRPNDSST